MLSVGIDFLDYLFHVFHKEPARFDTVPECGKLKDRIDDHIGDLHDGKHKRNCQ